MENEQLKQLIKNGFAAMKTGSETAAKSTDAIMDAAHDSKLKAALDKSNDIAKKWSERIEKGLQESGATEQRENPIIDGVGKVSKNILDSTQESYSRDLGIIAAGQLAIHYWIAAFGTMQSYAGEAELDETEKAMKACVKEAKEEDEEYTKIAEDLLSKV